MKYLLLLAVIIGAITLFPAHQAHAALAFVSTSTASSTTSGSTSTVTHSSTANDLIILGCLETGGGSDLSTSTATSSDLTPFTQYTFATGTAYGAVSGFYGIASTTGSNTYTCKYAAASTDRAMIVQEYSGNATTNVLDSTSTVSSTASITSSTATYSTTNANDVITSIVYANNDGSLTSVGAPFTKRLLQVGLFAMGSADLITSTVQTNSTFKWTFSSSPWVNLIASFKAAASAPATPGIFHAQLLTFDW